MSVGNKSTKASGRCERSAHLRRRFSEDDFVIVLIDERCIAGGDLSVSVKELKDVVGCYLYKKRVY